MKQADNGKKMNSLFGVYKVLILIFLVIVLCSCGGREDINPVVGGIDQKGSDTAINVEDINPVVAETGQKGSDAAINVEDINPIVAETGQKEKDPAMNLVTLDVFLEYLETNDVGITEEDLEGVDIEAFIEAGALTEDRLGRFNLKTLINAYKQNMSRKARESIFARDIKSVNSTDEEYEAFIKAYFEGVGKEGSYMGSEGGLDRYDIIIEDSRYFLYIGKTKNIDQYQIISGSEAREYCLLSIPTGSDEGLSLPFCYSNGDKFLLAVLASTKSDYKYTLLEIFMRTNPPH